MTSHQLARALLAGPDHLAVDSRGIVVDGFVTVHGVRRPDAPMVLFSPPPPATVKDLHYVPVVRLTVVDLGVG